MGRSGRLGRCCCHAWRGNVCIHSGIVTLISGFELLFINGLGFPIIRAIFLLLYSSHYFLTVFGTHTGKGGYC